MSNESNKKYYKNEVLQIMMTKLATYKDQTKIRMTFRSCEDFNDYEIDWSRLKEACFVTLRSTCDDDIHKAIKYGLWTSTY